MRFSIVASIVAVAGLVAAAPAPAALSDFAIEKRSCYNDCIKSCPPVTPQCYDSCHALCD